MNIDTKMLLNMISNQIADIINDDHDYYKNLNIKICEEQMFVNDEVPDNNNVYIVINFLPASVAFGQTSIPITLKIVAEYNKMEQTKKLFDEYAIRYNYFWNSEQTIQQVYETPSVTSNFNEIYEGFRSLLSMPGAILLIEGGNHCSLEYYPMLVINEESGLKYYDKNENDKTDEKEPKINFEVFKKFMLKKNIELLKDDSFKAVFNGYSWDLYKNNNLIYTGYIYDLGISFNGNANANDKITFFISNGFQEIEYINLSTQMQISLDSQPFYNSNNFTKSKSRFGSISINLTTYLLNNEFLNKCLQVHFRKLSKEPEGVNTNFKFRLKFQNGISFEEDFKLADFGMKESKGQLPVVSITFSE